MKSVKEELRDWHESNNQTFFAEKHPEIGTGESMIDFLTKTGKLTEEQKEMVVNGHAEFDDTGFDTLAAIYDYIDITGTDELDKFDEIYAEYIESDTDLMEQFKSIIE